MGIEQALLQNVIFVLFLGNSSVPRWIGTNPETTGNHSKTTTIHASGIAASLYNERINQVILKSHSTQNTHTTNSSRQWT